MDQTPGISVRSLCKSYGAVPAIGDLTFDVAAGEVFGLLGINGAGKTTTLECLVGLREADRGWIEIAGIDLHAFPRRAREKIGVALQSTSLPDKLTPAEALRMFGGFYPARRDSASLLERLGLAGKANIPFDRLSGGQRQRLAVALALVHRPKVILLDEPTAGLDAQARGELYKLLSETATQGCAVFLTTNQLDEAEQWCDRVAVLHETRLRAVGKPEQLIARFRETHNVALTTDPALDASAFRALSEVTDLQVERGVVRFSTRDSAAVLSLVNTLIKERRVELKELSVSRGRLEDVFLDLTGGDSG